MRISTFSEPANGSNENEDWMSASSSLAIVLDGATVRTDTGCSHGVSWYVTHLGAAISAFASDHDLALPQALSLAIRHVANLHDGCNLSHPGTPSAATAILRTANETTEYLVLGDITVVIQSSNELDVITDNLVDSTAQAERAIADKYPIGSPEKEAALVRMKHVELAARNRVNGYWVAAADPTIVSHALTDRISTKNLRRTAMLTDGAARIVTTFNLVDWTGLLNLLDQVGPAEIVKRIRSVEAADPTGQRWPRNKRSDDATIVYAVQQQAPRSS